MLDDEPIPKYKEVAAIKFLENQRFYINGPILWPEWSKTMCKALRLADVANHLEFGQPSSSPYWMERDSFAMLLIQLFCGHLGQEADDVRALTASTMWLGLRIIYDHHNPLPDATPAAVVQNRNAGIENITGRLKKENQELRGIVQQALTRIRALESGQGLPSQARAPIRSENRRGNLATRVHLRVPQNRGIAARVRAVQEQLRGHSMPGMHTDASARGEGQSLRERIRVNTVGRRRRKVAMRRNREQEWETMKDEDE